MKTPAVYITTGFILLIAAAFTNAATVDPPHYDPASGYTCVRCHTSHMDLGATGQKLFNNTCLNCHRLSDPKAGTKPFTPADAADPFNIHSSVQPKQRFQHSHRWDGSDTNPAAGALPPVYPAMTTHNLRGRTGGELACVRCHNQHNNSTSKPFLRMANSQDQMCLDCHRPRDVQDTNKGSHPVRVNYLVSAAKPNSNLKNPIENNNPANSTSDLNFRIALSGGQVLCTTCHGVHYTDSRSSTVDGAANFLSLSSSNGFILRTDMRGPAVARGTTDNLNICTNCHSGKKSHNYKQPVGQDVQCADCHAAHVDIGDGSQPNSFLVRRYMNISTPYGAVRKRPVQTMATSALSTVFINGSGRGTGVCQACHIVPTGGNYPAQHNTTFAMARDCATCHKHDGQFGSFSGGCTACHGFPPLANSIGGPNGKAAGYTGNESLSKHARHAGGGGNYSYTCDQCHRGNNHMDGNYQDVFRSPAGTLAATGMTPSYNTAASSCANIYCHSNGNGTPAAISPAWFGGPLGCAGCHGGNAASSSPIATGKHTAHVNNTAVIGTNYSCVDCHAKTVSNDTTIGNKSNHVNGFKDFSGARAGNSSTYSSSTGACSATYCHTDGKGTQKDMTVTNWKSAATLDCKGCHGSDAAPAFTSQAGEPNYANGGSGTPRANSHQKHAKAGASSCDACHTGTTTDGLSIKPGSLLHTNRNIDITFNTAKAGAAANWTAGTKSCANIACHFGGSAQWGGSLGCTGCHGSNVASGTPMATGKHTAHINNAAVIGTNFGCADCHAKTVSTDTTISTPANHANGFVDFSGARAGRSSTYNSATGVCSATYCHTDGKGTRKDMTATNWKSAATLDCKGCHGSDAAPAFVSQAGEPNYVNAGPGAVRANSHQKHAKAGASSCDNCHTGTTTSGTAINAGSSLHVNGSINVTFNPAKAGGAAWTAGTKSCSNIACHLGSSAVWGSTMPADCTGCHGNDAASANPIATGKHRLHLNNYSTLGRGNNFACGECHAKTVTSPDNRNITGPTKHANGFKDYSGQKAGRIATPGTGSCNTNYCHSAGMQNNQFWNMTSANWYSSRTLDCRGCHGTSKLPDGTVAAFASVAGEPGYLNGGSGTPTANTHQRHVQGRGVSDSRGCVACHRLTVDQGMAGKLKNYSSLHLNSQRNINFASFGNVTGHYAAATKTCSNTYCHSSGTPQWGGAPLACNGCHSANNTLAAAHRIHWETTAIATNYVATPGNTTADPTKYQFECSSCHNSSRVPGSTHANGPVTPGIQVGEVYFGYTTATRKGTYVAGASSAGKDGTLDYTASSGASCQTSYCHSDGNGGNGNSPILWTTTSKTADPNLRCAICHNYTKASTKPIITNRHGRHVNDYTFNCSYCHNATTTDGTTIADTRKHVNKVKDVAWNTLNSGGSAYVNSATACANIYCHSNGTAFTAPFGAPNVAVTWSTGPATTCGSCHDGLATGPSYSNGSPKANSHNKHVVVMGYTCEKCHYGTTTTGNTITNQANHLNKAYDLLQSGGAVTFTVAPGTPAQCNDISCHGGLGANATWGGTTPGCKSCHGGANDIDNFNGTFWNDGIRSQIKVVGEWDTTGHGRPSASGNYPTSNNPAANFTGVNECTYCHDASVNHKTATNVFRLANYSTPAYGRNAPCLVCHGKNAVGYLGKAVVQTRISSTHYGSKHASSGGGYFCWDCHDPHGDTNRYMIHDQVAVTSDRTTGKPLTFAAAKFTNNATGTDYAKSSAPYDGVCNVCHAVSGGANHYTAAAGDNHNETIRCTSCHNHNGPTAMAAFKPSTDCNACHGYPPVRKTLTKGTDFGIQGLYSSARFEDYSGGGGAHTISNHIKPTARPSEKWSNCAVCHSNGNMDPLTHIMQMPIKTHINNITIDVQDNHKFDYRRGLGQERYTGARLTSTNNRTGSCSNINCHFKPSKRWH